MKSRISQIFLSRVIFFVLAVTFSACSTAYASSGSWNIDASGSWSTASNWNPVAVPGTAAGDIVNLIYNITAPRTLTIDSTSRTVGTLSIGDPSSPYFDYTLEASGGADLIFDNGGSTANLLQTANSTASDTISAPLTLADNLLVNSTATLTLSGEISGPGKSITKTGSGTLNLSGANSYSSGTTVIGGGSLQLGATDTLPIAGAVTLGDNTSIGNLNLGTFSQKIASLTALSTSSSLINLINIDAGQSLVINGAGGLLLGLDAGFTSTTKVTMQGGGSLVVTNAAAMVTVGKSQINQNGGYYNSGTLDLAGLSSVTLGSSGTPINELRVGYGTLCHGLLTLSNTRNLLTATTVQIGHSFNNNGGSGTVILGTTTNILAVNTFNIGCSKIAGVLKFASQSAGSPGTVTIGGRTRPTADFLIGAKTGTGTGATPVGTLDLRGHTATVTAGTVTLGKEDGSTASGATGTILFDAGSFSANNLIMGAKSANGTGKATGTLTVNGGVFTVAADGAFSLASQSGNGSAVATLNIGGSGTLRSFTDIRTGPANCTGTINLNGGTLDMTGRAIGLINETVTTFNAQSGTLMNLGEFNAGAPLVKSGTGTLTLDGTNTYAGATLITGGTLTIGGAGLLGSGNYTADITNNAALVFSSSANQTLRGIISGSGSLTTSGSGTLTLTGANTYAGATAVTSSKLVAVTGGSLDNSDVTISSGATLGVRIIANDAQWSCKSLTLAGGTTTTEFRFHQATPSTTTAPLAVNGDLINNGTLNVAIRGLNVAVDTYPLISYTGTLTAGTLGTVSLLGGGVGTLVNNTVNKTIDLAVSVAGIPLVWDGGTGDWDIDTTANWAGSLTYQEGDFVRFDDSSSGTEPFIVSTPVDVAPGGVTVDNPTKEYTFAGPGGIGGEVSLTKRGAATLNLAGANTYSSGTVLDTDGGTLAAKISTTMSGIGSGPVLIGSGATLQLENISTEAADLLKANTFAGSGSLTLKFADDTTARSTTLPGISGFAGTIQLTATGSTGDKWDAGNVSAPDAGVQIASGNTLLIGSATASFDTINVSGTGNSENRGAIRMGTSATTLTGSITLLGDTTIASDIEGAIITGSITGSASAGSSNVLTQGTAASATGCTLSGAIIDGPNGGTVGLNQTQGILTLSGANTYSGLTTVNGNSTLQLGATDALPVTGAVILGDTSSAGNLNLGTFSQKLASLTALSTSSSLNNLMTIDAGQSLVINGSSGIFIGTDIGGSSTTKVKMSGGGSLVVTNASANVTVGEYQADESGIGTGSLDLAELSSVTLGSSVTPLNELRVAYGQMSSGTLTLSDTDNLITVTSLQIGNSQARNAGTGTLILGAGNNNVVANTINIGVYKANATVKFASQSAGSPGTVTIGGRTRATTDFVIGSKFAMPSGAIPTGTLDLRGHSANVTAGNVTLGREDNPGTGGFTGGATGTLLFDSGTFTATNLIMAVKSGPNTGPNAKATATLTVNGGEFTVTDGPITFAHQSWVGTANATLNINGGTFRTYADILTGPSNCTSTINLDGGTLDMTSHAIGMNAETVTVFNASSGTLMNLGEFNNGAPLVKTGTGLLSIEGTNTYAGATIVSNGTLRLTSTSCLPPTAILYLTTGTTTELDYTGRLPIDELYVDGIRKMGSLYGQDNLPEYLTGSGFLELPFTGTLIILR